jgi:hypothetical protein
MSVKPHCLQLSVVRIDYQRKEGNEKTAKILADDLNNLEINE